MPDTNEPQESNDLTDEIVAKREELADVKAQRLASEAARVGDDSRAIQQAELDRLDVEIEREKQIQDLLSGAGQEAPEVNETPAAGPMKAPRPRTYGDNAPDENKEN